MDAGRGVIPVAVGLVSSALYDVVRRLVVRAAPKVDVSEVEVVEVALPEGDRVVVRSPGVRS
jgi:hypothetical protein